jgi:hypothetical protein
MKLNEHERTAYESDLVCCRNLESPNGRHRNTNDSQAKVIRNLYTYGNLTKTHVKLMILSQWAAGTHGNQIEPVGCRNLGKT